MACLLGDHETDTLLSLSLSSLSLYKLAGENSALLRLQGQMKENVTYGSIKNAAKGFNNGETVKL